MLTSLGTSLIASNSVLLGLASVAVLLRFTSSTRTLPGLGRDDWLILLSMLFCIGLCLCNIIGVPVGYLGVPLSTLSGPRMDMFLRFSFAWQFFYLFAVTFVKLSALAFYGRVLQTPSFVLVQRTLIVLVSLWLVAFFWATLFQVLPVWCNWAVCQMTTDYPAMYICSAATDVVLDMAILALPLAILSRLDLSSRKKTALAFIFSLGAFCVAAATVRLVYTIRIRDAVELHDKDVNLSDAFSDAVTKLILWSGVEACTSIITACLPCFGPSLVRIPALQKLALDLRTRTSTSSAATDARFTGGNRDRQSARRLRLSGLSTIDTKMTPYNSFDANDPTDTASIQMMIASLPSPLRSPKIKGVPTRRNFHEPEIEMGAIYLRTGSEITLDPAEKAKETEHV